MPDQAANVLVVFYSRDGAVEALAKAIAEGAHEAGAEVRLRRAPDIVNESVMAKVTGWKERSERMIAEYGAPNGYTHAKIHAGVGTPYGSSMVAANNPPTGDDLEIARRQGKRTARIGAALKPLRA